MKSHKKRYHFLISILVSIVFTLGTFLGILYVHSRNATETIPSPSNIPSGPNTKSNTETDFPTESPNQETSWLSVDHTLFEYIEVTDSCGPHYESDCLVVRTGPGTEYPVTARVRNGMVLKIDGQVENGTTTWYKVVFDEWLRYPERLKDPWYIAADFVEILHDEGDRTIWEHTYSTTSLKRIVVDRSKQTLTAYEDGAVFMSISISTGLELTPTPRGTFTIFKKTPSRYMQGPLPGLADQQSYDLPGVPWNLYFTEGGAVIHGAYWHDSFGRKYSHGCVNLTPSDARTLYTWADLGTKVVVQD